MMDDLHDVLKAGGYGGHELERFLVRVLFCLFAQWTGIFEPNAFRSYIEDRTKAGWHRPRASPGAALRGPQHAGGETAAEPGRNAGRVSLRQRRAFRRETGIRRLQPRDARQPAGLHEIQLVADFAGHFRIAFPGHDEAAGAPPDRWPLHQRTRHPEGHPRRFFSTICGRSSSASRTNKNQLKQFHQKLARLRFLDPACGCGNFLVIAYRELRLLEIEVLVALHRRQQRLEISGLSLVDVDAFYGIEISEWPARIAEVAMWLMDHQMNVRLSEQFGEYFVRLPLRKSPKIVLGNALRLDWKEILPPGAVQLCARQSAVCGKAI